ncbi:MAG: Gfo/Idh/MocA family protein [Microthrixaceae bacterium]
MTGIGVVGIEHLHLFELVGGLLDAGAELRCHAGEGDSLLDTFEAWQPSSRRCRAEDVLADPSVDLVVVAGVPRDRAAVALAALVSGRAVLSDKPGATTPAQLDELRAAADAGGGRWWVLFSERFGVPAVEEAVRLARVGAVGEVVHVQGAAPHRGSLGLRPDWFFDRDRTGGILVDLGSHQADQFLAVTGAGERGVPVEVVSAATGNVAAPAYPGFEDVGEMVLAAGSVRGHHRVDYLEADGFPTWGDVRLVVTGTAGRLEVRTEVAEDGTAGSVGLWCCDHDGIRRTEVAGSADWAERLLADLADGGERLMTRDHPFLVTELTLRAAAAARPWGGA